MSDVRFIGVGLGMLASFFSALANILLKQMHQRDRAKPERLSTLHPCRRWGVIVLLYVLNGVMDFAAFAFAPMSLIAPTSALAIMFNAWLARIYFGELLGLLDKIGTVLVLVGSTMAVTVGASHTEDYDLDELVALYRRKPFIVYAVIQVSLVAMSLAVILYLNPARYIHTKRLPEGEQGQLAARTNLSGARDSVLSSIRISDDEDDEEHDGGVGGRRSGAAGVYGAAGSQRDDDGDAVEVDDDDGDDDDDDGAGDDFGRNELLSDHSSPPNYGSLERAGNDPALAAAPSALRSQSWSPNSTETTDSQLSAGSPDTSEIYPDSNVISSRMRTFPPVRRAVSDTAEANSSDQDHNSKQHKRHRLLPVVSDSYVAMSDGETSASRAKGDGGVEAASVDDNMPKPALVIETNEGYTVLMHRTRAVAYCFVASGIGSWTNLLGKSGVELMKTTVEGQNQFAHIVSWLILASAISTVVLQIKALSRLMDSAEAVLVVPIYSAMNIIGLVLAGFVYFDEISTLKSSNHLAMFIAAIATCCVGITLIAQRRPAEEEAVVVEAQDEDGMYINYESRVKGDRA